MSDRVKIVSHFMAGLFFQRAEAKYSRRKQCQVLRVYAFCWAVQAPRCYAPVILPVELLQMK